MSRIGATLHGFERFLLQQLASSNQSLAESSFRLATGKQVNSPRDDPSAFLQIHAFEDRLSRLNDVQANVGVAAAIGAGLQTTLDEFRTQLGAIRSALLEDEDNALTTIERSTNQSTVDAAIAELRNLTRETVGGKRFLDGSFDHTYTGLNPSQAKRVDVFSLRDDAVIAGSVAAAATQSSRRYTGAGSQINSGDATFTLTGIRGSTTITVENNESLTSVRDRINLDSHLTGIVATASGNNLDLTTVDYGDDAVIGVAATTGSFATTSTATGTDAVVTINGSSIAASDIDGNRLSYYEHGTQLAIELQPGFTGVLSSIAISDENVARFALSTRSGEQTKLALPGIFPELLGGVSGSLASLESGGSLDGLGANTSAAIRVVDEALAQFSLIEGRVDSFADVSVQSAGNLLDDLESNLEESLDAINLVDEDEESATLNRYQALSDNAVAAIAILQQQRTSMLELLRQLAGLS